jgi:hypothetical protein
MIGRVGRTPCQQLHGLLGSQQRKLEELESQQPRNETEIANVQAAIQNTAGKLLTNGCGQTISMRNQSRAMNIIEDDKLKRAS